MKGNHPIRLCADTAAFSMDAAGRIHVLLVKRGTYPHRGEWLLPGGHCEEGQTVEQNAVRELLEETGLKVMPWEVMQLRTFSDPERDPRGWYVSVLHFVEVPGMPAVTGGDDAEDARWFLVVSCSDVNGIELRSGDEVVSVLAFDHGSMLHEAYRYMVGKRPLWPTVAKVPRLVGQTWPP